MSVFRIYVEKKPEFAVEAKSVMNDVQTALRLNLNSVRILNRYDADNLSEEDFEMSVNTVFSEPAVDVTYKEFPVLIIMKGFSPLNIYRGSLISVRIAVSSVYRYLRRRIAAALETQEFILLTAI